ncbi:FAD-binding oxidoreductase [Occultella glacieicola]|nr:FAD-binding oxidoreductase [Occultella glacieicola]
MPAAIATPHTPDEVVEAVRRARAEGLRLAVRGGGHSLSATHLVDGAAVLDLRHLTRFDVKRESATAWVGPGVTTLAAAAALDAVELSFPVGHAPTVGLSGFLLAGGNGWNTPVWGHGCERVLAADVVFADGRRAVVDDETDPDLFRVLRGAGPAYPGVVVAFRLQLAPEPPRIRRHVVEVDARDAERVGATLDEVVATLPAHVDTTVFWHPARADDDVPTLTVAATSFAPGIDDGLDPIRSADLPVLSTASTDAGRSLFQLLDPLPRHEGDAMFSDHLWTDAGYRALLPLLPTRDPRLNAASSVLLTTSARRADGAAPGRAVYSPSGRMSVSAYAHWDPASQGPEHPVGWARQVIARLAHLGNGCYVGEADLTAGRATLTDCFGGAGADLVRRVVARLDPDRVMATPFTGHHGS